MVGEAGRYVPIITDGGMTTGGRIRELGVYSEILPCSKRMRREMESTAAARDFYYRRTAARAVQGRGW